MTAERDTTRIVRSWLRSDEHESADRVLQTVLSRLDTTPQRRSLWPSRRFVQMTNRSQAIIAAAAVVVVAILAYSLLPRSTQPNVGPRSAVPTTSPTAAPSGPASAFPPSGAIAAGRLSIVRDHVPLSLTVPTADWISDGSFALSRGLEGTPAATALIFWTDAPVGVFSDPCGDTRAPSVGTDVAALAAGVATVPGVDLVSGPTDTTVGGRPAKAIEIRIRDDIGCQPTTFNLWYSQFHARFASQVGMTLKTWIVDVDGTVVWIDGEIYKGAGPEPARTLQQLVDSITFD